jgi:hypothetical protein
MNKQLINPRVSEQSKGGRETIAYQELSELTSLRRQNQEG